MTTWQWLMHEQEMRRKRLRGSHVEGQPCRRAAHASGGPTDLRRWRRRCRVQQEKATQKMTDSATPMMMEK